MATKQLSITMKYTTHKDIPATIMWKPNNVVNERRLKFALTVQISASAFPFTNKEVYVRLTKTVRPSDWLKTEYNINQSANLKIKMYAIIIYIFQFVMIKDWAVLMK